MEYVLTQPDGVLVLPETGAPRCSVLVLSGSSGRIEVDRARLLAARGAAAMSLRWFGGAGQPPGICEVGLETFRPALDRLAGLCDRLAVVGTSKGAEAALLLAVRDARIGAVGAFSPTSVAWANVGPGVDGSAYPYRSSWTDAGVQVPFVPYDEAWQPPPGLPAYRELYERSLRAFPDRAEAARIPVERIAGRVLLVAGGDDQVWPSDLFAERIVARRSVHGLTTDLVQAADAGHGVRLPGEPARPAGGTPMARGGTAGADAALGHRAWAALLDLLGLEQPDVREVLERHIELFNAGVRQHDFSGMLAQFADGAAMRFEGVPAGPFEGRAAIAAAYRDRPPDDEIRVLDTSYAGPDRATARYAWAPAPDQMAGRLHLHVQNGLITELVITFETARPHAERSASVGARRAARSAG